MTYLPNFHHPTKMVSSGLWENVVLCYIFCPRWHWCSIVCFMFLFVLNFEFWGIQQSSAPYMWQVIFSHAPVKGNITLGTGECITSCDVTVYFTCVLLDSAIDILQHRLDQDMKLQQRTILSVQHITQPLEYVLF